MSWARGRVPPSGQFLAQQTCPLCSSLCRRDWVSLQNGGPCAHSPGPAQSSPLGRESHPVASEEGLVWRRGKQVSFFWIEDGQGWGSEAAGGRSAQQRLFVQGLLQAPGEDVASGPHCPAGWLGGHLSGRFPPFSCERQAGRDRGLGTAICSGSSLCRDLGPTGGVEGEGWPGSRQKAPSGRGRLCGAGLLRHHLCPAPPGRPGLSPLRGPLPAPGPGCADAVAPSNPQGQLWSQGLPTRPSCFSHGAASAGDSPRELPMGDQEAALPGDSLQH